jgi:hypothetical protein
VSDLSQGPGWWLASDGKWYPPQPPVNTPTGDPSPDPTGDPTGDPTVVSPTASGPSPMVDEATSTTSTAATWPMPSYAPPSDGDPGAVTDPSGYGPPGPRQSPRNTTVVVLAAVVGLLILLLLAGGAFLLVSRSHDADPLAAPITTPAGGPAPIAPSATAAPTPTPTTSRTPSTSSIPGSSLPTTPSTVLSRQDAIQILMNTGLTRPQAECVVDAVFDLVSDPNHIPTPEEGDRIAHATIDCVLNH